MDTDFLPLLRGRPPGLVERRRTHVELADVVGERAPGQAITFGLGETEFLGDQVRVGPDPLGVAAGGRIMLAQRLDEDEQVGRRVVVPRRFGSTLQLGRRAAAQGDAEAARRSVREHQRHLEEGDERKEGLGAPLGDEGGGDGDEQQAGPVARRADRVDVDQPAIQPGHGERGDDRGEGDEDPQRPSQHRPRVPAVLALARLTGRGPTVRERLLHTGHGRCIGGRRSSLKRQTGQRIDRPTKSGRSTYEFAGTSAEPVALALVGTMAMSSSTGERSRPASRAMAPGERPIVRLKARLKAASPS